MLLCITKFYKMRKLLLTLLFSIFSIIASTNLTESGVIENNNKYEISYSKNLPLYSPIKVDSIKRISDFFGIRASHPILKTPSFHKGIDFVANIDTKIMATAQGIVETVKISKYRYGNQVIINHGDGYKTRYAHMNSISVKEGDFVNNRDIIGRVGTTGLSTGPHLHYEIIFNGKAIDPLSLIVKDPSPSKEDEYFTSLAMLDNWYNYKHEITW